MFQIKGARNTADKYKYMIINPLAPELFFKIFAHPVFKM
jgi:hypothetical protein